MTVLAQKTIDTEYIAVFAYGPQGPIQIQLFGQVWRPWELEDYLNGTRPAGPVTQSYIRTALDMARETEASRAVA